MEVFATQSSNARYSIIFETAVNHFKYTTWRVAFITTRNFDREYGIQVAFVEKVQSELRGAEGMLQSLPNLFVSQDIEAGLARKPCRSEYKRRNC